MGSHEMSKPSSEEQKLDQIKQNLTSVINKNNWAKDCDPEGGSMWEAYDIGMCHGKTELAKEILNLLEK